MLVLDLLGTGVDLLLSLTLTTIEGANSLDVGLILEGALIDGQVFIELSSSADETVDFIASQFFDAIAKGTKIMLGYLYCLG